MSSSERAGQFIEQEADYGAATAPSRDEVLQLEPHLAEQIREHGERAYPEECCGILVGTRRGDRCVVNRLHAAENQREDEARHHRFLIPPEAILAAQRGAEEHALEIVGYYHSHPDCPAKPSEHDREAAWPGTSYLIVSVHRGRATAQRSWLLTEDRQAYREERIASAAS